MHNLIMSIDKRGVATLTLNRPERRNALDDEMIRELTRALRDINGRQDVRVLVLTGAGSAFCAGGDIRWMFRMGGASMTVNEKDAYTLAELLKALDDLSKPTIALVHGAVYGGGVGLVACCDIAIASDDAHFCLSEVKIGLAPAIVGPFIMRAIGARQMRRYALTAEHFSARDALRLGLVHILVAQMENRERLDEVVDALLSGAPGALASAKAIMSRHMHRIIDDDLMHDASRALAILRSLPEAREGLAAFLEKRIPFWRMSE